MTVHGVCRLDGRHSLHRCEFRRVLSGNSAVRLRGGRRPDEIVVSDHFDVSPPMSRVSSGSRLAARIFSR